MTTDRNVPPVTPASSQFWKAAESRQLAMQRCGSCLRLAWYPRFHCPHCGSPDLAWEQLSGSGVLYAVSVHHRSPLPALADRVPFAVVLVDLDEGIRMMSNVFGAVPSVGDPVKVYWEPLGDGRNLPIFELR